MQNTASILSGLRQSGSTGARGPIRKLVSSRLLTALFVVILLVAGACFYIWERVRALDLLAEVGQLEDVNEQYRDQLQKVDADVAELSRIGRISEIAARDFGLQPAGLDRLYAVRFQESSAGASGMRQLIGAFERSVAALPQIESSEAHAEELFDDSDR
jgi:cell division protein FtsL